MPGVPQKPPRQVDDPDLAALLEYRHGLHQRYPVSAEKIARDLLPDGSRKDQRDQRNLSTKILRLFREGIGRTGARWAYFEAQVRLGVPAELRGQELAALAELYRKAFPAATDCPPADKAPDVAHDAHRVTQHGLSTMLTFVCEERHQAKAALAATRQVCDTRQAALAATRQQCDTLTHQLDQARHDTAAAQERTRADLTAAAQQCDTLARQLDQARRDTLDAHHDAAAAQERAEVLAAQNAELVRQLEQLPAPAPPALPANPQAVPAPRTGRGSHRRGLAAPGAGAPLLAWGWLPRGLPFEEEWAARHTLVCWILTGHLPAVPAYAWYTDGGYTLPAETLAVLLLLRAAAGLLPTSRARTLAAGTGLLAASLVLARLTDGSWPFLLHYLLVVALLTVYKDCATCLLAVTTAAGMSVVLHSTMRTSADPFGPAWSLTAFAVAAVGVQLLLWRYSERSRQRAAHYRRQLHDDQHSVMAGIQETDRIRTELVGIVRDKFRAPLAGLRGALSTLRHDRHQLADSDVDALVDSAVTAATRLHGLVENMLTAATATTPDTDTGADLIAVLAETVDALRVTAPERAGSVTYGDAPPTLPVRMNRDQLGKLVANLLDNAVTHSWPGAPVRLTAGRVGDEVVLRVRSPGPDLDTDTIRRLFEPFNHGDSSLTHTADGAGLGLYVVRRLVESHGGQLRMTYHDGHVVVEVNLGAALDFPTTTDPLPDLTPLPAWAEGTARASRPPPRREPESPIPGGPEREGNPHAQL